MSAATTVSTWGQLNAAIRAHKLTPAQASADEQQLLHPTPANPTKKAPSPSFLQSALGGATAGSPLGLAEAGLNDLNETTSSVGLPNIPQEVVDYAIGQVEPIAKKVTLYAFFIVGAVALMVFGVSELLKPVGGPDLAGKAKTAGKLAIAGAAE